MPGGCKTGKYLLRTVSKSELEAVYRFRYEHFFHCFDDGYPGLDHSKRVLFEPHDTQSTHYCALDTEGDLCAVSTSTLASAHDVPESWHEWFQFERLAPLGLHNIVVSTRMVIHSDHRHNGLFDLFYRFIMECYLKAGLSLAVHYCSPGLICRYEHLGHRLCGQAFTMPTGLLRTAMFIDLDDIDYLRRVTSPVAELCTAHHVRPHTSSKKTLPAGLLLPNFRLLSPDERLAYISERVGTDRLPPPETILPVLEHASTLYLKAGLSHATSPNGGFLCLVLSGAIQENGSPVAAGPGSFVGLNMLDDPSKSPQPFAVRTDAEILVFDRLITRSASGLGSDPIELAPWRALNLACARSLPEVNLPTRCRGRKSMWNAIVDRQMGFVNFTPELVTAMRETIVAVVGTGGNGVILDHLVRIGFEKFLLIDPDMVEDTNLNRLPFTITEIGQSKVKAWERYLKAINPDCRVETHQHAVCRNDGPWLTELLSKTDLAFLGTTSLEANLVTGRICGRLGLRMIVGPASSGAYVVSTFVHDNDITFEKVAGFGTEHLELTEIDYQSLIPKFQALSFYPGRKRKLYPQVREDMLAGHINARSCKIFVSLTNCAMAFEALKNTAVMNGLPLEGTKIVAMPVFHIFDPYSGCAYYYHILNRQIGIPDWLTGAIRWQQYTGD
jgi:molybdopterin/thiamine biosynthesis adenylyltransferase